jgi:nicotinamide-nucleotide amidase
MPGVPHEMKGMMQDDVLPILKDRFMLHAIQHRTLLTAGIGESFLAEILVEFEQELPQHIKLAYLPSYGMVRLRLTTSEQNAAQGEIKLEFDKLKNWWVITLLLTKTSVYKKQSAIS